MCFLKKYKTLSIAPSSKSSVFEDTDSSTLCHFVPKPKNQAIVFPFKKFLDYQNDLKSQQILRNLISLVNKNSILINSLKNVIIFLRKRIHQNNKTLEDFQAQIDSKGDQQQYSIMTFKHPASETSLKIETQSYFQEQFLTQKLFGKKSYKYKLQLIEPIQEIIYKERNISILVRLKTYDSQIVCNSNIIHLCLGVCDNNAEWISYTRNGETFIKGKTQAQLYHGEGFYLKIYPRDVSRSYKGGKVNFVIYPKPSILFYSGNTSSLQEKVDYDEIQPLVLRDLVIRAKKKD